VEKIHQAWAFGADAIRPNDDDFYYEAGIPGILAAINHAHLESSLQGSRMKRDIPKSQRFLLGKCSAVMWLHGIHFRSRGMLAGPGSWQRHLWQLQPFEGEIWSWTDLRMTMNWSSTWQTIEKKCWRMTMSTRKPRDYHLPCILESTEWDKHWSTVTFDSVNIKCEPTWEESVMGEIWHFWIIYCRRYLDIYIIQIWNIKVKFLSFLNINVHSKYEVSET